jgi:mannonate dehydratase
MERAVAGMSQQDNGNPLKLRRALDHGVRVVVAHCASLGEDRDLDRGPDGPWVDSFALFERLMGEPRYAHRLFGDLSAMTQFDRADWLGRILDRTDWHDRLLNGSDYPLPGVLPIYGASVFAERGLLDPAAVPVLNVVQQHNPLLFDYVLKRSLRKQGRSLPARVFETRAFFERPSRTAPA